MKIKIENHFYIKDGEYKIEYIIKDRSFNCEYNVYSVCFSNKMYGYKTHILRDIDIKSVTHCDVDNNNKEEQTQDIASQALEIIKKMRSANEIVKKIHLINQVGNVKQEISLDLEQKSEHKQTQVDDQTIKNIKRDRLIDKLKSIDDINVFNSMINDVFNS